MQSILLILFLSTTSFTFDSTETISDHLGKWEYTVDAPDMTYKGIMEFSDEDGTLDGTIQSDGVTIPLEDVVIDGDELTFSMNVQGFMCKVSGTFSGSSLKGVVAVDGFEMPLNAKRKE